jgi:hypothetical protein
VNRPGEQLQLQVLLQKAGEDYARQEETNTIVVTKLEQLLGARE